MNYPPDFKYTKEHEWIHVTDPTATVGITDHAQEALGDIVYVDLPAVGAIVKAEVPFGTVESVKAVSELYAPASGEVMEINESLKDAPEVLNSDPHGQGWLIKIRLTSPKDLNDLMNAEQYAAYVAAEANH
jgi:glycine cleavage system H protein